MRSLFTLLLFILIFSLQAAEARPKRYGIGLIIFEPTQLATAYYLKKRTYVDLTIAFEKETLIQSTYVQIQNKVRAGGVRFYWYYGLGGRARKKNDFNLGVRGSLGIIHRTRRPLMDVFAEVAPSFEFIGETVFATNIGVGARFVF